jgi:hypothetical protein
MVFGSSDWVCLLVGLIIILRRSYQYQGVAKVTIAAPTIEEPVSAGQHNISQPS